MFKKSKKIHAILLVVMVLLTTSVSCAATQPSSDMKTMPQRDASNSSATAAYTDISSNWAYEAISYVLQEELMDGTSDTTFSPDQTMAESDFSEALNRMSGETSDSDASDSSSKELTRQNMAQMLYEYVKSIGFDTEDVSSVSFTDASETASDAYLAISAVTELGLMSGKSDGSFQPDGTATRAEAATVIYRLCMLIDEANTSDDFISKAAEKASDIEVYTNYKNDDYESIALNGNSISYSGSGADVDGSSITITSAGTYVITGTLKDGQIIVDSEDDENVRLVLNNTDITSKDSSPILINNAKNAIISLPSGTSSALTDGLNNTDEDAKAALFSKDDLWINGSGTLTVNANYKDGISGNDDIKITEATLVINAADDGIVANDALSANNAVISIKAVGDGIKTTNGEEIEKGYIAINSGSFSIDAGADGIQAETLLYIESGDFQIATSESDSDSAKGLKSGSGVVIKGGDFDIDSTDDAVHSNGIVRIDGGSFDINTGDDGIHGDTSLIINGGTITVTNSYEGIESANMEINGGKIDITASDDGINVAGGNDSSSMGGRPGQNSFTNSSSYTLTINGGDIQVNASGDGIDVNGSGYMTGGNVQVNGPTNDGNGALDYDGVFEISGGTLLTAGSSGMAQAPSDGSTQYTIANTVGSQSAGTTVKLVGSDGSIIASFIPVKNFAHVVISTPEILKGGTYTLSVGGTEIDTFTVAEIVSGDTSSGGGMPGGGQGQGGGFPGGRGQGGGMPDEDRMPDGERPSGGPNGNTQ